MILYYKLRRNLIISAKRRRGREKKTEKESKLEREKGSEPERELYLNKETSLFFRDASQHCNYNAFLMD